MSQESARSEGISTQASAHGRVNLIGEHTDYNGGFVLPTAIPQQTRVELSTRGDRTVRAWSAGYLPPDEYEEYELGEETRSGNWLDYVQGITRALRISEHQIGGFDVRIESTVPTGSGLSSSAALEVSLLRALRAAFGLRLSDVEL